MEKPHQVISRLLTALETLTREEEHLFETGFFAESTAVQQRSMPLVHKIAELLTGANVVQTLESSLQIRIQTLLQNRRTHYDRLSAQLETTRKELEKINAAQVRARKLRPAYRTPALVTFVSEA
jgi:hypothetical protein